MKSIVFYITAVVFALFMAIVFNGCSAAQAGTFKTKHGLIVDNTEAPWVTKKEVEIITEEFLKTAHAHAAFFSSFKVYIYAEVIYMNGDEYRGLYFGDNTDRPRIEVSAIDRRCFAQNSLVHELAHRWLDKWDRDPDQQHKLKHWWNDKDGIVARSVAKASARLCGSPKTTNQLLNRIRRRKH